MKISVVVPVYREPKHIEDIVRKIRANDYTDKEIVIAIDGPMTPSIQDALEDIGAGVTVLFPNEHRGKAETLNITALGLSTDILLFLDNDIVLPEDTQFLTKISRKMQDYDIVDMPKEVVVESIYSSMIGFEYQGLTIASWIFSSLVKRSPAIIGSAFAVKKDLFARLGGYRRVVHEDADFGARAFRLHARYRCDLGLKVQTTMPNCLRDWVVQRKRWTTINVYWFKENFLHLLADSMRQPAMLPGLGLILLPSVLSLTVFLLLDAVSLSFLRPAIFMLEYPLQMLAGILIWFSQQSLYSDGLISTALGFVITTALYYGFSRVTKFRFNVLTFILFYFLYMPLLVAINVVMFALLSFRGKVKLEWKL